MTPEDLPRLPYPGVVDADGHVLEAPDLWEKYLEAKYRDRAVRIRKDDLGLEYLEVDGKPLVALRLVLESIRSQAEEQMGWISACASMGEIAYCPVEQTEPCLGE